MIEIFSKDRDIDYEMFVYDNGIIKYTTKEKNSKNNKLYYGLNRGTIILNGVVLNPKDANLDDVKYVKDVVRSLRDEVISYKKDYKPVFIKYTTGNSVANMIKNSNVIEIPDRKKIREWTYITAFDYLTDFVNEFEKLQNPDSFAKKIVKLF